MVASLRTHTDAVIAALEGFGLTVGDASGEGLTSPFCVVYPIPGGATNGSLEDPNADAELIYQSTCVGKSREQAEWVADKTLLLLSGFSVTGRVVTQIELEDFGGVSRDDDVQPPLWYGTPRFRVYSTPA